MQIKDAAAGYGWLSIALHWANAIAVVMVWFIGNKATGDGVTEADAAELLHMHTSVAVTVYALVWARIVWRLYAGHPNGLTDQGRYRFVLARVMHYTLLVTLATLLISGPLEVWLAGEAIDFYNLGAIPSPFAANDDLAAMFTTAHRWGGNVLLGLVLVHVTAAARQLVFAQGETAKRMTAPTGHGHA